MPVMCFCDLGVGYAPSIRDTFRTEFSKVIGCCYFYFFL